MTKRLFLLPKTTFFVWFFLIFYLLFPISSPLLALTNEEQEAIWRAELQQTEKEIAEWQSVLDNTKANTKTLQQEAATLNAKIQKAKAFIKQKNIQIGQLEKDIGEKSKRIKNLEEKIIDSHDSLAQLLRKTNEIDNLSLAEVALANQDISDFWSDIDTFQSVNRSLQDLLDQIRTTKALTEKEKVALALQKDKETDTRITAQQEQKKVEANEKEKQKLIQYSKTQEKSYEQVLAERQTQAAQIRVKLFRLAGGAAAIPFGEALAYAQNAYSKTGVQPAFVLAILTQESNLGANVGKCFLTSADTGAGININTNKVWPNLMKASRDVPPFLEITKSLGLDPFQTVVSCPIASTGGYGGAMGPAQFIASTWKLLQERLADLAGHSPNPWDAQDAFLASSLYLKDLGASSGTYSAELRAACKYYGSGGSTCSYGRSVMNLRASIQNDIDYLNQNGISRR